MKKLIKNIAFKTLTLLFRFNRLSSDKASVLLSASSQKEVLRVPLILGKSFVYGVYVKRFCDSVKKGALVAIKTPDLKKPVHLRAQSSDVTVFHQIFVDREFDVTVDFNPEFIIDGGANVGCFAVLYASLFPEAIICAVEPESTNFEILNLNASAYDNIYCLQSGIWNKSAYLKIRDNPHKWGVSVYETTAREPGSFPSVSINDILKKFGRQRVDILKLDIEGSEEMVFACGYENWLSQVRLLIIELHEKYYPGSSRAFTDAIKRCAFNENQVGEHLVLRKIAGRDGSKAGNEGGFERVRAKVTDTKDKGGGNEKEENKNAVILKLNKFNKSTT